MKGQESLFPKKGRPPAHGKRVAISCRVTQRLKQLLDLECERTGRSQSDEVKIALMRHFSEFH